MKLDTANLKKSVSGKFLGAALSVALVMGMFPVAALADEVEAETASAPVAEAV